MSSSRAPRLSGPRTRRTIRRVGPLLVAVVVVSLLSPIHGAGASSGDVSDYIARINALRVSVGSAPLAVDGELTTIAQNWSAHMAATGQLIHSPSLSAGITQQWTKLGENIGFGPSNGPIWTAFVKSAGHYANIVDPAFNRVGVGVVYAANGTQWTTQRFMQVAGGSTGGGGGGAGGGGSTTPPKAAPKATTPKAKAPTPTTTAPVAPTTTAPPAPIAPPPPQPGPPPPADSARVAAVLSALRHLAT